MQPRVTMNSKYLGPLWVVGDRGLSLPSNYAFNSALTDISPQLTNTYLVTRVVQCRSCESCAHLEFSV